MTKYKIHIDPPKASEEDVSKYKNFSALTSEYQKVHTPLYILKNIYRNPKLLRIIILIIIIVFTLIFSIMDHEETKNSNNENKATSSQSYNRPSDSLTESESPILP